MSLQDANRMPPNARHAMAKAAARENPQVARFINDTMSPDERPPEGDEELSPAEFARRLDSGQIKVEDPHA